MSERFYRLNDPSDRSALRMRMELAQTLALDPWAALVNQALDLIDALEGQIAELQDCVRQVQMIESATGCNLSEEIPPLLKPRIPLTP